MRSELLTYWKTWLVDCSMVLDHVQWDVMSTCRNTHHPEHMMQWLQQQVCAHKQLGHNLAAFLKAMCRHSRFDKSLTTSADL